MPLKSWYVVSMKVLVFLAAVVTTCVGNTILNVPRNNSHYVEGESRYIWMSDGCEPKLVDLQQQDDVPKAALTGRSGANNQYWLFTRNNPTTPHILSAHDCASISNSNYVGSKPLKVLAHGWTSDGNSIFNTMVTEAFLADADVNVIVVDWSYVSTLNYVSAVLRVPDVGKDIGSFLTCLLNTTGGNWNNVHLVGYSLGAHVIGNAGRATGGLPARITGLDPAGPLWRTNSNALSANNARYVEVIHTDGLYQGIFVPIGHADFYPNVGVHPMPGCPDRDCSHARAYRYFAASIYYNHLAGRSCDNILQVVANQCRGNTLNMGNSILSKRGSGLYGLSTGADWPY